MRGRKMIILRRMGNAKIPKNWQLLKSGDCCEIIPLRRVGIAHLFPDGGQCLPLLFGLIVLRRVGIAHLFPDGGQCPPYHYQFRNF